MSVASFTTLAIPAGFNPADVQGNILRGFHRNRVRHMLLGVRDAAAARRWLGAIVDGSSVPQITTEVQWSVKPDYCFTMGLTAPGLTALGVAPASLASFPDEFVQGMNSRAIKLGDVGDSAPEHWEAPFTEPDKLHLIATIHADDVLHLDRIAEMVGSAGAGAAFVVLGGRDGWNFDSDYVHFGYRDNFSQPRFVGIHDPDRYPDKQPLVQIGAMLMGYATDYEGLLWNIPQPDVLGRNGGYNAFRILAQDVVGYEAYLDSAATGLLADPLGDELLPPGDEPKIGPGLSRHAALRDVISAKMCGRWKNGVPLVLSPDTPNPPMPVSMTDFDYSGGLNCPFGAHMRRCNPRGGNIVQLAARHTRRLVRRSFPYGPPYDPARPDSEDRGLLGNFVCANLAAQFEALTTDWLNLGLQDPRITTSNDPLLGANQPDASWLDIPLASGKTLRLKGFPRFVRARGGAYTFLPGIPAIRYLAALGG